MINAKEIINQSNIRKYFDYRAASTSQLKPGMLVSFRYRSPDRHIHDVSPLIYVLEHRGDRVYGLNLHYHFGLMGGLIMMKRKELEKKVRGYKDTTNEPDPKKVQQQKPLTQTKVVNAQSIQQQRLQQQQKLKPGLKQPEVKPIVVPKVRIPPQLLEFYQLQIEPVSILRNYLFPRMSGIQKLIFKA